MSARDLLAVHLLVGLACAIAVVRRAPVVRVPVLASAAVAIPLWPLWAPFALLAAPSPAPAPASARPVVARIDHALSGALAAVAGTPLEGVFTRATAERVASEVTRVVRRLDEVGALAARMELDAPAAAERLRELERSGAPARSVATARLQHESLSRLDQLRAADGVALDELADLLEALRAQLVVARFEGSSANGVEGAALELSARLEILASAGPLPSSW